MKITDCTRTAGLVVAFALCAAPSVGAFGQSRVEPVEAQPAGEQPAQDAAPAEPTGRKWILDCAAAINRARSIRWDVSHRKEGNLPVALGGASARVTMLKPEGSKYNWIMRAQGAGNLKGGDAETPFDIAWYLDQTQFIDSATGSVAVRRGRVNEMAIRIAESVRVKEMIGTNPWQAEMDQADATISGEETVNGASCVVVDIAYRANKRTARLWIAKEDRLPRRFAQYVGVANEGSQFSASFITDFSNVELNPALTMQDVEIAGAPGATRETFAINTTVGNPDESAATKPAALARPRQGQGEVSTGTPAGSDTRPEPARGPVFEAAPGFALKSADGSTVSLDSLRGSVVVLDFWGTWSLMCKQSSPEVQGLHERFKGQPVRVLGMAVRERSEEKPIAYFKERGFTYTLLLNADSTAAQYGVRVYPTFVVISPSGEIVHKHEKYVAGESLDEIAKIVEKHLPTPTVRPTGG